jgi:hypothetical protein
MTHQDIGDIFGFSRQRSHQITSDVHPRTRNQVRKAEGHLLNKKQLSMVQEMVDEGLVSGRFLQIRGPFIPITRNRLLSTVNVLVRFAAIINMLADRATLKEMSEILGVTPSSISRDINWMRLLGVKVPRLNYGNKGASYAMDCHYDCSPGIDPDYEFNVGAAALPVSIQEEFNVGEYGESNGSKDLVDSLMPHKERKDGV